MPKRQFPFSAIFGFRNPTQEIFSELDETKAEPRILPRQTQNTEGETERGQGGPTPPGGAAKEGGASRYGVGPSGPLRGRPFAYIFLATRKPYINRSYSIKTPGAPPSSRNQDSGDRISVPSCRRDGEVPLEAISIDATASIMLRE